MSLGSPAARRGFSVQVLAPDEELARPLGPPRLLPQEAAHRNSATPHLTRTGIHKKTERTTELSQDRREVIFILPLFRGFFGVFKFLLTAPVAASLDEVSSVLDFPFIVEQAGAMKVDVGQV